MFNKVTRKLCDFCFILIVLIIIIDSNSNTREMAIEHERFTCIELINIFKIQTNRLHKKQQSYEFHYLFMQSKIKQGVLTSQ